MKKIREFYAGNQGLFVLYGVVAVAAISAWTTTGPYDNYRANILLPFFYILLAIAVTIGSWVKFVRK